MQISTALAKLISGDVGIRRAVANGKLCAYSATAMPATADAAPTGTLLATVTLNGGAYTGETLAQWSIPLTGASGSVNTIKIGGVDIITSAVNFTTDLTTTAAAIATAINNTLTVPDYTATSVSSTVYVNAPVGSGTALNSLTCTTTVTTMTATPSNSGNPTTAGVAAVNGLNFQFPAVGGVLTKETTTWQDSSADASGTVKYMRLKIDPADDDSAGTSYRRIDFSVGSSGADIIGAVLTTTATTPFIVNTFTLTLPQA